MKYTALLACGPSVRSVAVVASPWGTQGWRAVADGGAEGVHDTAALAAHLAACRACARGETIRAMLREGTAG